MKRSALPVLEEMLHFLLKGEEHRSLAEVAAATNLKKADLRMALRLLSSIGFVDLTNGRVGLDPLLKEIMKISR